MNQFLKKAERSKTDAEMARLTAEISGLRRKRERVIDGFIEGVIEGRDRDRRLAAIDDGIRVAQETLNRAVQSTTLDLPKLIEAFTPLAEWEYWTRDQKRQILSTLVPDIRVADYQVESIGLNPSLFSNEVSLTGTGSLRLQA